MIFDGIQLAAGFSHLSHGVRVSSSTANRKHSTSRSTSGDERKKIKILICGPIRAVVISSGI